MYVFVQQVYIESLYRIDISGNIYRADLKFKSRSDERAPPEDGRGEYRLRTRAEIEEEMYELFLLGKLMERPWHGYEFHQVLNSVVGPARQVSWGTIYPLLQRLEKAGLIQRLSEPADRDDGRGRQRFSITHKGKQRFLQLMKMEPRNDPNYRDTFRIKLGNFSRVDIEIQRQILHRYLDRLSSISVHTKAMSERVSKVPEMDESERQNILLALAHDRFLAESESKWIRQKLRKEI